jgi:hypothetical protein
MLSVLWTLKITPVIPYYDQRKNGTPGEETTGKQQNKSKYQNVKTKQSIDELNAIQTTPLCCECGAIDRRISYVLSVKLIFVSETKLAL